MCIFFAVGRVVAVFSYYFLRFIVYLCCCFWRVVVAYAVSAVCKFVYFTFEMLIAYFFVVLFTSRCCAFSVVLYVLLVVVAAVFVVSVVLALLLFLLLLFLLLLLVVIAPRRSCRFGVCWRCVPSIGRVGVPWWHCCDPVCSAIR